ncbi:MAG: sugar transferase [Marinibacterium sp.]
MQSKRTGRKKPLRRFYPRVGKRVFDCALILLALPVVVPVIALLALLAAMDGAAPFYWQERVGRHGRVFRLLKIRTMVPDAENVLDDYLAQNPAAREEWDLHQKLHDDPRITRIGGFVRKTSMDELPQLWNVLIGDMSLVGPRPMMVDQRPLYPGKDYYRLRPGITGLWQISERNNSSFAERAVYDTRYFRSLSLKTDFKILWATVGVVLRATGY